MKSNNHFKQSLTPSQSQRLIELGVDPSKASMMRLDFNGTYAYVSGEESDNVRACVNAEYYVEECEIFDLSDILSLLPKTISLHGDICQFEIKWHGDEWIAKFDDSDSDYFHSEQAPELIDALFELLCWTLTRDKE